MVNKGENSFCTRDVEGIKRRLIVMSTNLEYKERERLRKRERRRQVSEAHRPHREKSVRELEREIKNKGEIFR